MNRPAIAKVCTRVDLGRARSFAPGDVLWDIAMPTKTLLRWIALSPLLALPWLAASGLG
jgi:hypothetical protein